MILLAQLSDTHFNLHARNAGRVERVLAYLSALPRQPEAILLTGDITDKGTPAEYEQARATLHSATGLRVLPGNHDDRAALRRVLLGEDPSDRPLNQSIHLDGLTVALLDSTVPGTGGGALGEDTIAWLTDLLRTTPPTDAVLIALHHPPLPMYSTVVDPIRLADPRPLERIVATDDRILGVLTGHMHTHATTLFGGKPLIVAPSVASTIGGSWEVTTPGEVPIDYAPDPAILLHVIDNARLTTLLRPIPVNGRIATL